MMIIDEFIGAEPTDKKWLKKLNEINNRIISVCEQLDNEGIGIEYKIHYHNLVFESDNFYRVDKITEYELKHWGERADKIMAIEDAEKTT